MALDFHSWLYSLDESDLHKVAIDHGIDPLNYEDDVDLIDEIAFSLEK